MHRACAAAFGMDRIRGGEMTWNVEFTRFSNRPEILSIYLIVEKSVISDEIIFIFLTLVRHVLNGTNIRSNI